MFFFYNSIKLEFKNSSLYLLLHLVFFCFFVAAVEITLVIIYSPHQQTQNIVVWWFIMKLDRQKTQVPYWVFFHFKELGKFNFKSFLKLIF